MSLVAEPRMQCTLEREAEIEGLGLFSSIPVVVRFKPAPPNTGIILCRTDLDRTVHIPATIDHVMPALKRTTIAQGDIQVHTCEHLLAAAGGLGIDNLIVEIDNAELPGCDGSAASYVRLFNQAGIVSLSFCFDQNMRPCVAYETSSGVFLRWYDSAVVNYVTTSWGATFRSPRVTLDDKRLTQFATRSDIIFAYIRGEFLCYRQQRDRFTTERVLQGGVGPNTKLNNVGMNRVLRLQFDLA